MKIYYVIGVYSDPWVLDGPLELKRAYEAIRWQGGDERDWVVGQRTGPDTFIARNDGRTLTVGRGPYTIEAFDAFKAEWKAPQPSQEPQL